MLSSKLSITDVDVRDKRVLIRVDFNVPLEKSGSISNTQRIDESLPTIHYCFEHGARIVTLMSHLGRPEGRRLMDQSLRVVADYLTEVLPNKNIIFCEDCVGSLVEETVNNAEPGSVILLENLRFHPEEEGSGLDEHDKKIKPTKEQIKAFRDSLSRLADIFVNDAFGTAHRAHSSMVGVEGVPKVCGFLMKKELDAFARVLENPERPFLAILGGAKVKDKIQLIYNMLEKVDEIIIGGGMAFTFLHYKGVHIGDSLLDKEGLETVPKILQKAQELGVQIHLPVDFVVSDQITDDAIVGYATVDQGIPKGLKGLDIGDQTIQNFSVIISRAKTVLWNGPMGVFEKLPFGKGSRAVLDCLIEITKSGASTIVGGGDTASCAQKFGGEGKVTHISTGGGASLELLEGKELPGVVALSEK